MDEGQIWRRAFDLSLAVYRVTALLPSGEALVGQLREVGNEIVGEAAAGNWAVLPSKLDKILIFFEIAREQQWIRAINWTALSFEYGLLRREIGHLESVKKRESAATSRSTRTSSGPKIVSHNVLSRKKPIVPKLSPRQKMILAEIEQNDSVKMSDLFPLFKENASERTLRNELHRMIKIGLVKKEGDKKTACYSRGSVSIE
jgi:hypothetical protein